MAPRNNKNFDPTQTYGFSSLTEADKRAIEAEQDKKLTVFIPQALGYNNHLDSAERKAIAERIDNNKAQARGELMELAQTRGEHYRRFMQAIEAGPNDTIEDIQARLLGRIVPRSERDLPIWSETAARITASDEGQRKKAQLEAGMRGSFVTEEMLTSVFARMPHSELRIGNEPGSVQGTLLRADVSVLTMLRNRLATDEGRRKFFKDRYYFADSERRTGSTAGKEGNQLKDNVYYFLNGHEAAALQLTAIIDALIAQLPKSSMAGVSRSLGVSVEGKRGIDGIRTLLAKSAWSAADAGAFLASLPMPYADASGKPTQATKDMLATLSQSERETIQERLGISGTNAAGRPNKDGIIGKDTLARAKDMAGSAAPAGQNTPTETIDPVSAPLPAIIVREKQQGGLSPEGARRLLFGFGVLSPNGQYEEYKVDDSLRQYLLGAGGIGSARLRELQEQARTAEGDSLSNIRALCLALWRISQGNNVPAFAPGSPRALRMARAGNVTDAKELSPSEEDRRFFDRLNKGERPNNSTNAMASGIRRIGINEELTVLGGTEYSTTNGLVLHVGLQKTGQNKEYSVMALGSYSKQEKELLAGLGIKIGDDGRLTFLASYYTEQKKSVRTSETFVAKQYKFHVNLAFHDFDASLGVQHSPNKNLQDTTLVIDSDEFYSKYLVRNRFVGETSANLLVRKRFEIGDNTEFFVGPGVTVRRTNDGKTTFEPAGNMRLVYYWGKGRLYVEATLGTGNLTVREGVDYAVNNDTTIGLGVSHIQSFGSGNHRDTNHLIKADVRSAFDINGLLGMPTLPSKSDNSDKRFVRPTTGKPIDIDDMIREVAAREGQFGKGVRGTEKEVGRKLLFQVDKRNLPKGVTVNKDGDIIASIEWLSPFTAFRSVLRNDSEFVSSGIFIPEGGGLRIRTERLPHPAIGTIDKYVLITNANPADRITFDVHYGSLIVKNIKIDRRVDIDPPTATMNVAVDETTATVSATQSENGKGYLLALPKAEADALAPAALIARLKQADAKDVKKNVALTATLTGLASGQYVAYYLGADAAGNFMTTPQSKAFEIKAEEPFTSTLEASTTTTSIAASATMSRTGNGYFHVLTRAEYARLGAEGAKAALLATTPRPMTANQPLAVNMPNLAPETEYVVLFIGKDAKNHLQSAVTVKEVTTLASSEAPVLESTLKTPTKSTSVEVTVSSAGRPNLPVYLGGKDTGVKTDANGKAKITLPLTTEGTNTFALTFFVGGKETSPLTLVIERDTNPPDTPTLVSPLPASTQLASIAATIRGEKGTKIFLNGVDTGLAIDANTGTKEVPLTLAAGANTFNVTLQDVAENVSKTPLTISIVRDVIDINPPAAPKDMKINGGAASTESANITVSASHVDPADVKGYYVSFSATKPSGAAEGWVTDATSIATTISEASANTKVKVYIFAKDASNNVSDSASAEIIYDKTVSKIDTTSITFVNGTQMAGSLTFNEKVKIKSVSLVKSDGSPITTGTIAASTPNDFALGQGFLYTAPTAESSAKVVVTVIDELGVEKTLTTDAITVTPNRPAAPTGLSLNSGAASTTSATVNLTGLTHATPASITGWFVTVDDANAPAAGASGWVATKPTTVDIPTTQGSHTVRVYAKNASGGVSDAVSDAIIFDVPTTITGQSVSITYGQAGTGSTAFSEAVTVQSIVFTDANGTVLSGESIACTDASTSATSHSISYTGPTSQSSVKVKMVVRDANGIDTTVFTNAISVAPPSITAPTADALATVVTTSPVPLSNLNTPTGTSHWLVTVDNATAPAANDGAWTTTKPTNVALTNGAHTVRIYVKNAQGGVSSALALTTTYDALVSAIGTDSLSDQITELGAAFTGGVTFNESVTVQSVSIVDGDGTTSGSIAVSGSAIGTSINFTGQAPTAGYGNTNYRVKFVVLDNATSQTKTLYTGEFTPFAPSISAPTATAYANTYLSSLTVNAPADLNTPTGTTGWYYTVDSATAPTDPTLFSGTKPTTFTLPSQGTHTVRVYVRNALGGISSALTLTPKVDTLVTDIASGGDSLTGDFLNTSQAFSGSLTFNESVTVTSVRFINASNGTAAGGTISATNASTPAATFTFTGQTPASSGEYQVEVTLLDAASGRTTTRTTGTFEFF